MWDEPNGEGQKSACTTTTCLTQREHIWLQVPNDKISALVAAVEAAERPLLMFA